ncbi:MAG: PRC-barrel domain-containing protein [Chloroflexia bacterium]
MKRLQQLKGMPVLSLQEGEVLGRVREAIVDVAAGRVVALTLDRRTPAGETQVVATANIRSVGKEAITVEDRSSVVPISRIPRFKELAQRGRPLRGRTVMTEQGVRLGRVADATVDEANFRLAALVLQAFWGRGQVVPMERVRTIGTDAVVVWETVPQPTPASPAPVEAPPPPPTEAAPPPLPAEEVPPAPEEAVRPAEPAIPLVSTPQEVLPVEPAEPSGLSPLQPSEGGPAEAPVAPGSENPWQRWVHRLFHRT